LLQVARDAGVLERTIPDVRPRNQQRYRLSETGKRKILWMEKGGEKGIELDDTHVDLTTHDP
jgi:hypothetical protein